MLTAIVGANWGDEGKGRMVDLLSRDYTSVIRYQGGNNAGHTVVNERGKFILNLIPSGILRPDTVNVMGGGMVIDLEHLHGEVQRLRDAGVGVSPRNLRISDRAVICMPYHREQDIAEEERLADHKFGSTRRGIAPVYGDKYMKKAIRMTDLLHPATLRGKVDEIVEWKNLTLAGGYGRKPVSDSEMYEWLLRFGGQFRDYICDTTELLNGEIALGKNLLFEAQLGALRDIEYGIYPFTSSSPTLASYAPIGAGIPGARLDNVIAIVKAYSSCVGEGPFTCEMSGEDADCLRAAGGEYGAATGRPRRVGAFDVVATRFGVAMQGATSIALTKLDVLSYMDRIPVCTAYHIGGRICDHFPTGEDLFRAEPVIEYLDGFRCDISACRRPEELPDAALAYIRYIEKAISVRVGCVSVGADREAYITLD